MSINDLIHTNAHNAFEQGVKTERERIIKLLEKLEAVGSDPTTFDYIDNIGLIALIKMSEQEDKL